MRVAFLGLGAIGQPMAARVAARHELTVWNRSGSKSAVFAAEHKVRSAVSPREAVTDAEVVVTCLPLSRDVEALVQGPNGILAGAQRGAVLVDCTSGDPATSRRIATQLHEKGLGFLDAPVSGGTNGAAAGTLTVMVGGEPALLERVRPVLESFGSRIVHMGGVGAGDAMKAVNNALLAVNILAVGEGLAALTKAGVDPRLALDVLNSSSGRSFVSEQLVPERVLSGSFPRTFRLALLHKDAGIAVDLLKDQGVEGRMLALAHDLYRRAHAILGEDADYLEAIKLIERQAGVEIRE